MHLFLSLFYTVVRYTSITSWPLLVSPHCEIEINMTHTIVFKKISSSEMEITKSKMKCPTLHPVWAGAIVVTIFLFAYFCREGLMTFMGTKWIDAQESTDRIKHQHRHRPTTQKQQTSQPNASFPPHSHSDSSLFRKIQRATLQQISKNLHETD